MEDNRITLAVRVDRNLHRKIKMLAMQQGKSLKEYMIDLMLDSLEKEKQIQVHKVPEKDENYIYENGKKIELLEDEKEEDYIPNDDENIMDNEIEEKEKMQESKEKSIVSQEEFIQDLVENFDNITTSDLQAIVQARCMETNENEEEILNVIYERVEIANSMTEDEQKELLEDYAKEEGIEKIETEENQAVQVENVEMGEIQEEKAENTEIEEVQEEKVENTQTEELQENQVENIETDEKQENQVENTETKEIQEKQTQNIEIVQEQEEEKENIENQNNQEEINDDDENDSKKKQNKNVVSKKKKRRANRKDLEDELEM